MSNMSLDRYVMPLVEAFGEFVDVPAAKLTLIQAEGRCPYVAKAKLGRAPADGEIETLGFVEECSTTSHQQDHVLHSSFFTHKEGGRYLYLSRNGNEARIAVAAEVREMATETLRALSATFAEADTEPNPNLVPVRFNWYASGVRSKLRMIESPEWGSVASNYPGATRDALQSLHEYNPEQAANGRLLMFHGAPGTGKTTAVRSLARAWSGWCTTRYVVDPESLFSIPEYLLEVALDGGGSRHSRLLAELDADEEGGEETGARWQLIVVEDVDELIRVDAKDRTGQALGRLLNLTDGLLGQGLRIMFLLTTNERMGLIHPAVSRPGRCLANIEFTPFTKQAAEAWLREKNVSTRIEEEHATLAELYALTGAPVISAEIAPAVGHGTYL